MPRISSNSTMASGYGDRIRTLRRIAGLTQRELAERIGADTQTVSRWEREEHPLTPGYLRAVSQALKADPAFIAVGRPTKEMPPLHRRNSPGEATSRGVAEGASVRLRWLDGSPTPFWVSKAWLKSQRLGPQSVVALPVSGEGMAPTLLPRDVVWLDTSPEARGRSDGIFLVRIGPGHVLARGQLMGRTLRLGFDNPGMSPYVLTEADPDWEIVGVVVHLWRGL